MSMNNVMLLVGGLFSLAVAVLHLAMIPYGARAYRYFTAPEWMIAKAEAGSLLPNLLTIAITAVLTLFGLYALSGAGYFRALPLLWSGLALISGVYVLRGLGLVPQVVSLMRGTASVAPREAVFSLVSLIIGVLYAAGTLLAWPSR